MSTNTLNIAEKFYSVQCEGASTGYPAYFIRLKGCNLSCGFSGKHTSEIAKAGRGNTVSGDIVGDLHWDRTATWSCDTLPIWLFGDKTTHAQMIIDWKKEGIYDWIRDGRIHLIWTGGEPTIPKHQKDIVAFLKWMENNEDETIFNEIETNGTFPISDELSWFLDQINCSVKLANSGMTKEQRIVPAALESIMNQKNYWFKFVISEEKDLEEIHNDFIVPFNIPWNRTIMMPGLDSRENFHERTRFVLEMAKKYGYIGMSRLHVSAWDKTVSV